jgi:hypothetical protein
MFFYGENAYSETYDTDYRRSVSYVALYWITLKLKLNPPGKKGEISGARISSGQ